MKTNGIISLPVINTDTSSEPVTLQEIKDYLRISNSTEDTLLATLGKAARKMLEKYTGRFFKEVNITVKIKNEIGAGDLPYPANGSVTYVDTIDSTNVITDLITPTDHIIQLTYNTGYTTGVNLIPEDLKLAILGQAAFMYFNRGDDTKAGQYSVGAKYLASGYKVSWI